MARSDLNVPGELLQCVVARNPFRPLGYLLVLGVIIGNRPVLQILPLRNIFQGSGDSSEAVITNDTERRAWNLPKVPQKLPKSEEDRSN